MRTALIAVLALLPATASAADVAGQWKTPTRNAVIEISHCGGALCGRLVTSDGLRADPDLRDTKNRDPGLRGRRLMGLSMLSGFTGAEDGRRWTGGQLYNPDDGGTYKGTLTLTDPAHLAVRGCIVWPLCKTQTWTRLR